MKKLWRIICFKDGFYDESDCNPSKQAWLGMFLWATIVISFFIGASEAGGKRNYCTINRPIQLYPAYLIGCVLWGKNLPEFQIKVGKE